MKKVRAKAVALQPVPKKRGRPPGKSKRVTNPHKGSLNDALANLDVGTRLYVETTVDHYAGLMRRSVPCRRPAGMAGMEFTSQLFTAVAAYKAGDVRYIVCFERTK